MNGCDTMPGMEDNTFDQQFAFWQRLGFGTEQARQFALEDERTWKERQGKPAQPETETRRQSQPQRLR